MSGWLPKILNLDPGTFQGEFTWQVKFAEMWPSPALFALAAAALAAFILLFHVRETRGLSPRLRIAMTVLRLAAMLALFAAVASPALVIRTEVKEKSRVFVLVDESGSMLLKDNYQAADARGVAAALSAAGVPAPPENISGMTRADIAARLATSLRDNIARRGDFNVSVYGFGERLRVIDDGLAANGRKPVALSAGGDRTEIGTALAQLLAQSRQGDLSAVIVISDGCNNAGTLPHSAADMARERRVPVHVLGIGNPRHPRDISVANFLVNDTILLNDSADLAADVQAWGYDDQEAEVVLFERPDGGEFKDVARQKVKLPADGRRMPVRFEYAPREPGDKTYKVEVAPRPDEARADNNAGSAAVSVVEGKLRVLYLAGEPSWEYRVLSRALIQDKMVDVSCWLQSADPQFTQDGDESIDKLPDDPVLLVRHEKKPAGSGASVTPAAPAAGGRKDAKEFTGYDVVILSGLDPADVPEKFVPAVIAFVRDFGGGLLFAAGPKSTPHALFNSRAADLLTLLPVEIEEKYDTSSFGKRLFADEFHLRLTPEGADMKLTQFGASPAETRDLWEKNLPGFYWYYPVRRAKPGATVIATHERDKYLAARPREKDAKPMPVIATQFFGKGRVMFVGVDGTWRWRKDFGDKCFYKFWSQSLHFLGKGNLLRKHGGVTIATDKPGYVVGDTATIRARVVDEATLEPSGKEFFAASVERPLAGEPPQTVKLAATDEKGWYEGSWKAVAAGSYEIWLQTDGRKPEEKPGLHRFGVELPAREMGDVKIDEAILASLVAPDGRLYSPAGLERAAEIASNIRPVTETRAVQRTQTIWDSPGFLVFVIACLVAEWIVRKRKGLV